jgi:hypothetical protein
MYIDILGWSDYIRVHNIKHLSLNEQMKRYNYYLMEQQAVMAVTTAASAAGSGGTPPVTPVVSNCIEFTADTTIGGTTFDMAITTTAPTTATVDWGDGTVEEIELGEEGQTLEESIEHTYAEEDTAYNVTMCFSDPSVITNLEFYGDD